MKTNGLNNKEVKVLENAGRLIREKANKQQVKKFLEEIGRDDSHNGWENRETWAFKIHIDNDGGYYNYWNERAKELELYNLEKELKEWVEEIANSLFNGSDERITEGARSMLYDVGSIWRINYRAVAEALREENTEREEHEKMEEVKA